MKRNFLRFVTVVAMTAVASLMWLQGVLRAQSQELNTQALVMQRLQETPIADNSTKADLSTVSTQDLTTAPPTATPTATPTAPPTATPTAPPAPTPTTTPTASAKHVSVHLVGGLGNQLFEAASSFGIAVSRGATWCISNLEGSILQQSVVFRTNPPSSCAASNSDLEIADEGADGFMQFHPWMMKMQGEGVLVRTHLQSFRSAFAHSSPHSVC